MNNPEFMQTPISKTGMLIRKPVTRVFEAFINPAITTQFWFTKSTGPLEIGKQIRWDWEMYSASAAINVIALEPNERLTIQWPGYSGLTTVEWKFMPQSDTATFVTITETGFTGDADSLIKQVADSVEGFTLVLAGLKAFLEHNLTLNLVRDRFPQGMDESSSQ